MHREKEVVVGYLHYLKVFVKKNSHQEEISYHLR
jgi:hypothetical protein